MTFHPITAAIGARAGDVLPADNARPDRFTLMDTLRQARAALGLKAPTLATLDALLSCLPPKRNHDFVFASNATIAFKRNGISERTIRRHIAQLAEIGLLTRSDSPNRKRFSKHDSLTGSVLRFGFDLSALYEAFPRLCALAEACTQRADRLAYLRSKLRAAIARRLELGPFEEAELAQRALRRILSAEELEDWLEKFAPVEECASLAPIPQDSPTEQMTVTAGQNDRLHQNSKKELLDSEALNPAPSPENPMTLAELVENCPEARSYLQKPAETPADVITHARLLAPMMGIDRSSYDLAEERLGQLGAAVSVWGLLQMQGKIRQIGAYFRAVTSGKKAANFDPWALIRRLGRQRNWAAC